jgi:hypothetical protein
LSRRKDLERYQRLKQQNPDYPGFRGAVAAPPAPPPPDLESVLCSLCGRRRNVPRDTLPTDRSTFVCLSCQPGDEEETALPEGGQQVV